MKSYIVTTQYPEGFRAAVYGLSLAAAHYFRQLVLDAGAASVTIEETT